MPPTISSEDRLTSGHRLSHPPPGDEVYITGISGYFPDSNSVIELQENLFNKVDLISGDERRWKCTNPEIPQRTGKINKVKKFDASFFGLHYKEAHTMDPMCRILLEKTYEAIYDAGINPNQLRNTNTGVFVGACFSESEITLYYEMMQVNGFGVTGCSRAMLANRISYWLGLNGPSYTVDTACSSSLYAIDHAFRAIRDGHCDAAIVGGSNLCLHPFASLQFARLGVLSLDGSCKSFDNKANGYARSEAIVVVFLQKSKDSKRVYAQIVHSKANCDGYKEQGISYPAGNVQKILLNEFYEECSVSPMELQYVEAHGTGTAAGDPEELNAVDDVFCTGRSKPLLIGSVKSNLGHSEGASGTCSIAKIVIANNTGCIPPNLHYSTPRAGIPALTENRLKVVTEKTPWNRGLAGVSGFGFGGANAHVLLKNVAREKVNKGIPTDDLPRLVCTSGRTVSAVARILDDLESRTVDAELIGLLHSIHKRDIPGHMTRGFSLLGSEPTQSVRLARDIQDTSKVRRPVWFMYSGMGSQWVGMGKDLMRVPIFAAAIEKCQKALQPKGINLIKIITDFDPKIFDNILNSVLGIAAVQIGLTDVLNTLAIQPDHIIGHGIGELGCAYADGCFTTEQTILAAYSIGLASVETQFVLGTMAVVGLGYDKLKPMCPPGVDIAYHVGPDSSTISGPIELVESFMAKLNDEGVFSEEVLCSSVPQHSRYISEAGPKLMKYLSEVIPNPKARSERWVSTSVPQGQWGNEEVKLSSAEYFTNNCMSPVQFEESSQLMQDNAIIIEIAPNSLLEQIPSESSKTNNKHLYLSEPGHSDNVQVLLTALGNLFVAGLNLKLANIYPKIEFPVSIGTPMLSHLVEWKHNENWFVAFYKGHEKIKIGERTVRISLADENYEYLAGHVIDGRNLYPATGYLALVWETLGMMIGKASTELSVVFENVRFQRATNIPKEGHLDIVITVHRTSGDFEIVESGASVVTGKIYAKDNVGQDFKVLPPVPEKTDSGVKHLLKKDFYKELRLRGYQYSGLFRGVIGCNVEGSRGRLAWANDWVSFMDCMLQMNIIDKDTRNLFVPTRIEKLSIDVNMHYNAIYNMNPDMSKQSFEVRVYTDYNVVRAGGVEIRGMHATPITRKAALGIPVLEKNVFVPNFGKNNIKVEDAFRTNMQLILENIQTYKVKAIELVDEEYKNNSFETVIELLGNILEDIPLMQPDLLLITEDPNKYELPNHIVVDNKKITGESNTVLFIGANLLERRDILEQALGTLRDKCFIASRETKIPNTEDFSDRCEFISMHNTGTEYIVLFRKHVRAKPAKFIKIVTSDDSFTWIERVKNELRGNQKVVLYSQNEEVNGLLGLVNCLRREPGGEMVYGVLINDTTTPEFNPDLEIYKNQLAKDLAINILQDGLWGTYRHLLLDGLENINTDHAYVAATVIGDLSSLRWLEGPLSEKHVFADPESVLVQVYCSALNFRDVMTATGRVAADAVARGRINQECVQGFEVVGRTPNGSRVMSLVRNKGISNMVESSKSLLWCIPDEWTFEEACTVPMVYATVLYSLVMVGRVKPGESVLIHAGSGGVGQAAISVALHYGCEVFTTVGTAEKRAFIKKLFPQLKDSHIGNSRDCSFEDMIFRETNGKGVDLVLNSLSDEILQASVRCLAYRGRFLEIGKYDISNNTPIGMHFAPKETSFHGIMLDYIFDCNDEVKTRLRELLISGIESGAVRPLTYCTFEKNDVEAAFRYMAAGKHVGKLIIKIRDEETKNEPIKPAVFKMDAVPSYACQPDKVYIVVGGLGGFGLELADWLILRGARKLVLTSRRGISNGYQAFRLKAWAGYGAEVQISTDDITTSEGCEKCLKTANKMGPVKAIFNLAVILRDSVFQNQTPETFKTSFGPKAIATMHLDRLSKKLCPELMDFVVFSSVSCGRGNAGQTNYGMSNSVMERICEQRKKQGFPALAIQWGAIGDVGLVADMQDEDIQIEIGGTLQQRISSCFTTLEKLLRQNEPIVSSIVVAEKKAAGSGCGTLVDAVAVIMGIKDLKTVSQQVSLAELGMDSMMAVEIKQTLEREFEIFLTAQDIRTLTFGRLMELNSKRDAGVSTTDSKNASPEVPVGLGVLVRNIGDEEDAYKSFIDMPTMLSEIIEGEEKSYDNSTLFLIPGLEGSAAVLAPICKGLKTNACVLQLGITQRDQTEEQIINLLYQIVKSRLAPKESFKLLGYSFGAQIVLGLAAKLENEGHTGVVFCLDGAPKYTHGILKSVFPHANETVLQHRLIYHILDLTIPNHNITDMLVEKFEKIESFEAKIRFARDSVSVKSKYSDDFIIPYIMACFDRLKVILNFNANEIKVLKSPIVLIRPIDNMVPFNIKDNYCLDEFTEDKVTVHFIEGNHITITENKEVASIINNVLDERKKQHCKTEDNVFTNMVEKQNIKLVP